MRKLKKLLMLAIIPTTILFNTSFAFADTTTTLPSINNLQLMFDQLKTNPEFQNGQLYVSAKFVTKSGLMLQWNSETGSFVVGGSSGASDPIVITPSATPIINPVPAQPITVNSDGIAKTSYKGLNAIIVDGETYFKGRDYYAQYREIGDIYSPSYIYDKSSNSLKYQDRTGKTTIITNDVNAINLYMETVWINSKYYK